jgi:hypothetical protein
MSVGSPATASAANAEAIDVELLEIDDAGIPSVIGSYRLLSGASVDVSAVSDRLGGDAQIHFNVLKGSVSFRVGDTAGNLRVGETASCRSMRYKQRSRLVPDTRERPVCSTGKPQLPRPKREKKGA